jgi:hypothetical protein
MKTKLHFSPFPTKQASKTFFQSALMTAVILLLALGGAKLLPLSSSSAKQNTQNGGGKSCPSCGTRSNQIIYLPLIDLPEAQGSEIVFNSRSPQEMDVTPTFYKLDGTAIVGNQCVFNQVRFDMSISKSSSPDHTVMIGIGVECRWLTPGWCVRCGRS